MAMTKKEQAEMDRLRREAAMAKALAWPTFEKPEAMQREHGTTIHGWWFNQYSRVVAEGWADVFFYTGDPKDTTKCRGGRQNHDPLYATESDAYRAMIHELAREYAETLAGLYAKAGIEL